jgi:hypothetical protein
MSNLIIIYKILKINEINLLYFKEKILDLTDKF